MTRERLRYGGRPVPTAEEGRYGTAQQRSDWSRREIHRQSLRDLNESELSRQAGTVAARQRENFEANKRKYGWGDQPSKPAERNPFNDPVSQRMEEKYGDIGRKRTHDFKVKRWREEHGGRTPRGRDEGPDSIGPRPATSEVVAPFGGGSPNPSPFASPVAQTFSDSLTAPSTPALTATPMGPFEANQQSNRDRYFASYYR